MVEFTARPLFDRVNDCSAQLPLHDVIAANSWHLLPIMKVSEWDGPSMPPLLEG